MVFTEYSEKGFKYPAKLWVPVEEIEHKAMDQIRAASRHPELAGPLAVMPDVHVGYGLTIGSVFALENAISPNAVGVDINCGMAAFNTGVPLDPGIHDKNFWRSWSGNVMRNVPSGANWHNKQQDWSGFNVKLQATELQPLMERAGQQLGTLGGGNHFLEAQVDENGLIWFMVHSGSRHLGLKIAGHYHKLAVAESHARGLDVPDDLATLLLGEGTGVHYIDDMTWAGSFALESRARMMHVLIDAFSAIAKAEVHHPDHYFDTPHNFARREHLGMDRFAIIHRKGATSAMVGEPGIIPGSMGTPSYIVTGTGSPDSYASCSHGSGRTMGRGEARRTFTVQDFANAIESTYSKASPDYLDESPMAYKDSEIVISRQTDLVTIAHRLQPIITVKGSSKARDD